MVGVEKAGPSTATLRVLHSGWHCGWSGKSRFFDCARCACSAQDDIVVGVGKAGPSTAHAMRAPLRMTSWLEWKKQVLRLPRCACSTQDGIVVGVEKAGSSTAHAARAPLRMTSWLEWKKQVLRLRTLCVFRSGWHRGWSGKSRFFDCARYACSAQDDIELIMLERDGEIWQSNLRLE